MYKMEHDINKNTLTITTSEFMTKEESISYIKELGESIKNINFIQYNIFISSRHLQTTSPNSVEIIKKATALITHIPFTTRYSLMPRNPIRSNIGTLQSR